MNRYRYKFKDTKELLFFSSYVDMFKNISVTIEINNCYEIDVLNLNDLIRADISNSVVIYCDGNQSSVDRIASWIERRGGVKF